MLAEHGISFWIDTGTHRLLFDTGQGLANILSGNADRLQTRLDQIDAIVLSHGHYDHTGGLKYALSVSVAGNPNIYVHPFALNPKYTCDREKTSRYISIPFLHEEKIRRQAKRLVWTNQPTQIFKDIFVTGEIPRNTKFEDTGGSFFLDKELRQPASLLDDQACFLNLLRAWWFLLAAPMRV